MKAITRVVVTVKGLHFISCATCKVSLYHLNVTIDCNRLSLVFRLHQHNSVSEQPTKT